MEDMKQSADRIHTNIVMLELIKDYCSMLDFNKPISNIEREQCIELMYKVFNGATFQEHFLNVVTEIIESLYEIKNNIEQGR